MKKFKVATLGCRTNQYESQAYIDQLGKMGYLPAEEGEEADLCIVNTCTVTQGADRSSRQMVRSLIKENPLAEVVVTGCMVESHPDHLLQIGPQVKVVQNKDKEKLIQKIFPEEENLPEFQIQTFDGHTRAFVKVQDGCNSFCTYCIIPYVRGRSRSRAKEEILQEIKGLIKNGYKEVVITGINVGDFDGGGDDNLASLIREVDQIKGLERLRISSIDPDEVDDDLLDAVLNGKTTCPSMHIVLQAGSNVILKKMNRKYTRQMFIDTVMRLIENIPDFTLTTDVIVGFPGETESDFQETLELIETLPFAKVHMFPYSVRKRTRAALYPNQVPQEVIRERKQRLLRVSEKKAFDLRSSYIGRKMKVLLESESKKGFLSGHTENFLRVITPKKDHLPNDLVELTLTKNEPEGLFGI